MKKFLIFIFLILIIGCNSSTIDYIEDNYDVNFPSNYQILKDTIEGNIDYQLVLEVKFINKKDIKKLIYQLNEKKVNIKQEEKYKFTLRRNDKFYDSTFEIDTLNNTLIFKEYHY